MSSAPHFWAVLALFTLLATSVAQPPNGMGPPGDQDGGPGGLQGPDDQAEGTGESASTTCPVLDGRCSAAGSFVERDLTYDKTTGLMSGSIVTNQCPSHSPNDGGSNVDCIAQAIPDPSFPAASAPMAAPLLGRIALTLKEGNNIYGPLDAGFGLDVMCTGGVCDGGSDLTVCQNQLTYQCGEGNVDSAAFMDDCGGHGMPYHHHFDLTCDYTSSDSSAHSPAIAVALDGYVVYGKWERDGAAPVLDACNGHFGPTPADATYGIEASGNVYHYHSTATPPYLIGCYGPAESVAACKEVYPQCNDEEYLTTFKGLDGSDIEYNLWCPCYQHNGVLASVSSVGGSDGDGDGLGDDGDVAPSDASLAAGPVRVQYWMLGAAMCAAARLTM